MLKLFEGNGSLNLIKLCNSRTCSNTQHSRYASYNILSRACSVWILSNASSEPCTDFIVIPAACTCTSVVPSPLLYVDPASKGSESALFQDAGNILMHHSYP